MQQFGLSEVEKFHKMLTWQFCKTFKPILGILARETENYTSNNLTHMTNDKLLNYAVCRYVRLIQQCDKVNKGQVSREI